MASAVISILTVITLNKNDEKSSVLKLGAQIRKSILLRVLAVVSIWVILGTLFYRYYVDWYNMKIKIVITYRYNH